MKTKEELIVMNVKELISYRDSAELDIVGKNINCMNCEKINQCTDCSNCASCINCIGCINCTNCTNCNYCRNLNDGKEYKGFVCNVKVVEDVIEDEIEYVEEERPI